MNTKNILLVEDEQPIREMIVFALTNAGYEVYQAADARQAQVYIAERLPDLILLDWMLPGISGIDYARRLKKDELTRELPIIMLTARAEEEDKVQGLESGADDYVTKPFSPRELVARVRAVLRRARQTGAVPGAQPAAGFEHDAGGMRVRYRGRLLELTRYEYGLLAALLARPGAVLSRAQLMDRVWGDALDTGDRTIDTHVKTLRAKLHAIAPDADPIRTHRGLGYSLAVD